MKAVSSVLTRGLCTILLWGCAAKATPPAPPPPAAPPPQATPSFPDLAAQAAGGPGTTSVVTKKATVEKIDQKSRMVTLRGEEGGSVTFRVDERVKNLPQVKKGDEVVIAYYESIAVKLKKPGEAEPGIVAAEEVKTAEPGQKPAGIGARVVTVTATITAVDKSKSTVTVRGPEGNSVTVKVQNPSNLEPLKTGDLIQLTFTEALAISVEKPPKAK